MQPRFGFTDEVRAVFTSRGTSWGALAVYRGDGEPPFTREEVDEIGGTCGTVAAAIQRSLFRLPAAVARQDPAAEAEGPAVLIVDAQDRATHLTPAARAAIEELGGWDHGSLPSNVLAVVASTRSTGEPFTSRSLSATERWVSVRAAPLEGGDGGDIVVSIEATSTATLSRLALTARGLTSREEEGLSSCCRGSARRASRQRCTCRLTRSRTTSRRSSTRWASGAAGS
jgi:hypothetical protein